MFVSEKGVMVTELLQGQPGAISAVRRTWQRQYPEYSSSVAKLLEKTG